MTISYLFRSAALRRFSIERVFETVMDHLPPGYEAQRWEAPSPRVRPDGMRANMQAAAQIQADIAHVTGDIHYVVPALRVPSVLTIHDCTNIKKLSGLKRTIFRYFWFVRPVRAAGAVTAISSASRDDIVQYAGCAPDRVQVILNPLTPGLPREPKAWPQDKVRILIQGSFWNKNRARQIEALAGLPVVVNLVGDRSEDVEAAAQRAGVEMIWEKGLSDAEMRDRYVQADAVMFASLFEGFGMPIIEAQQVGRPVITSNRAPMPEVGADAALYADPEDTASLRGCVQQLLDDAALRDRLIERGFANVERFQPERVSRQYADVYDRLRGGAN
jgi:glycosyltransferase involved in cell wall biosynthesis